MERARVLSRPAQRGRLSKPSDHPASSTVSLARVLQRSAGNRALARRVALRRPTTAARSLQRHVDFLPGPDYAPHSEDPRIGRLDLATVATWVLKAGLGERVKQRALVELDAADMAFALPDRIVEQLIGRSRSVAGPSVAEVSTVTASHTEQVHAGEGRFDEATSTGRMLRGIFSSSSFASKLDEHGQIAANQRLSDIEQLRERTENFLEFAGGLGSKAAIPVYRTIKPASGFGVGRDLSHPLPFSSTLSLAFARSWANTNEP